MIQFDYTLAVIVAGTVILGCVSGLLGSFAVLRRQSLLGDAISHASLPGVALAFLLTLQKNPLIILLGAAAAGWVGTLLVMLIVRHTVIKEDAALGIILSVFFGFGLVLLTIIQRLPNASKSGLDTFLFGSASTLLYEDVRLMLILGAVCIFLVILFWKEFKLLTFDRDFAASVGYPVNRFEILLTGLIVVAIVVGLQTVGVVLMSAMIIAPAAGARQWTDKLWLMVSLSALFGAFSGVSGALISSLVPKLPTGPTIVLIISTIVFISMLFSPHRGILWSWVRDVKSRRNIRAQAMLTNLLLFSESETNPFHAHDLAALTAIGRGPARKAMADLKARGLVSNPENDKWALTAEGVKEAHRIRWQEFGNTAEEESQ